MDSSKWSGTNKRNVCNRYWGRNQNRSSSVHAAHFRGSIPCTRPTATCVWGSYAGTPTTSDGTPRDRCSTTTDGKWATCDGCSATCIWCRTAYWRWRATCIQRSTTAHRRAARTGEEKQCVDIHCAGGGLGGRLGCGWIFHLPKFHQKDGNHQLRHLGEQWKFVLRQQRHRWKRIRIWISARTRNDLRRCGRQVGRRTPPDAQLHFRTPWLHLRIRGPERIFRTILVVRSTILRRDPTPLRHRKIQRKFH